MPRSGGTYVGDVTAKRKKKKIRGFLFLAVFGLYILCASIVWLFIYSPVFRITQVEIVGTKTVSDLEIQDLLKSRIILGAWWKPLLGMRNILDWPSTFSSLDLVLDPSIKGIQIAKNYFRRKVVVTVTERAANGIWCYEGGNTNANIIGGDTVSFFDLQSASPSCWWFDDEGIVFERSPASSGGIIAAVSDFSQPGRGLYSKVLPDIFLPNMLSIFSALKASGLGISGIILRDISLQEIEVHTAEGPRLYMSLRFPADNIAAVLKTLSRRSGFKNIQYIDFRVEDKVYYK